MQFDWIIAGGGSAGCVLANRLSAASCNKVLLIEAGPDHSGAGAAPRFRDIYPGRVAFDPDLLWSDIRASKLGGGNAPPTGLYEQARLLGGGSAINGQVANRGTPADYDDWAAEGAAGWGWHAVLPYFRKLERDEMGAGPLHGADGPIPITRVPRDRWPGFAAGMQQVFEALGYGGIADQNARFEDGHFPLPLSNDGTHRVSAAHGYLTAEVRRRSNLTILTGTEVQSLAWEGATVTGLRALTPEGPRDFRARATILSMGAIHSAAFLMASGVGDPVSLRAAGIEPRISRPGIGRNLQEHAGVSVSAYLTRPARNRLTRRHGVLGLRRSSGHVGCPDGDLFTMVISKSAWHPLGDRIGTLLSWINKPFSRGEVRLRRDRNGLCIEADFNLLGDARDSARLRSEVGFLATCIHHPALAGLVLDPGPSIYSGAAKALGQVTRVNRVKTLAAAHLLDHLPGLRSRILKRYMSCGFSLDDLLHDEAAMTDFLQSSVFGQWHACGTCRMGDPSDPLAVTDPETGRVHGASGLHVIDASVMPVIPRANLNIPVLMLAEKFAAALTGQGHPGT